eukprot:scaffold101_cov63-Phaeocystis_antarctica.AAC.3
MLEPAESSTPVSLLAATLGPAACGLLLLVVNGQSLPGQQGWPCPRAGPLGERPRELALLTKQA